MSTPNRKISFYLKPEHSRADRVADEMLDTLPVKARGNACRTAMLAGMALMRQDARLPGLIAELFDETVTIDQIRQLMRSIFPDEDYHTVKVCRDAVPNAQPLGPAGAPISTEDRQREDSARITKQNARDLFPL